MSTPRAAYATLVPPAPDSQESPAIWTEDPGLDPMLEQARPKAWRRYARMYTSAMAVCVVCTLLNVLLLALMARMQPATPSATPLTRKDLWMLRRPSQYMYLDEIERPFPPTHRHFDNFPLAVSHVDRSNAKRVMENESRSHMGASGVYTPKERHIVITEHVSTPST